MHSSTGRLKFYLLNLGSYRDVGVELFAPPTITGAGQGILLLD